MQEKINIIVAVTGASGSLYAKLLLDKLMQLNDQLGKAAVIFSDTAKGVWQYELPETELKQYPFDFFEAKDFYAPPASGSAKFDVMITIPCSMGTLGRISNGTSDDLIARSADVMLKERRKLILVTREAPLNLIHIENMATITRAGGIICPASPSFYSHPKSIEELVNTVVHRVLALSGFNVSSFEWGK